MHTLLEAILVSEVVNVEEELIVEEEDIIKEEVITKEEDIIPTPLAIENKIRPAPGEDRSSPLLYVSTVGILDISSGNVGSG